MKWCNTGKHYVPLSGFTGRPSRGPTALQPKCKNCSSSYAKNRNQLVASGAVVRKKQKNSPRRKDWGKFEAAGVKGCPSCEETLPFACFYLDQHKTNGLRSYCIKCTAIQQFERYHADPAYFVERSRAYYRGDQYEENLRKGRERANLYRLAYPERVRAGKAAWTRRKLSTDVQFKIVKNMRTRTWKALKGQLRAESCIAVLGCTVEDFIAYIGSLFEPGMTWDNYGDRSMEDGWELDHIKPLNSFEDLTDPVQFRSAFGFPNLRPLRWRQNQQEQYRDNAGNVVRGRRRRRSAPE